MADQISLENYDQPLDYNLNKLRTSLSDLSPVIAVQHRLSERFTLLFREQFADIPFDTTQPRNKSNWTHHTYFAIRTTAKALALDCTFETMGRLDAVIETFSEYPGVILLAEWESDAFSVFGSGNELEKLWSGVNEHDHADAFLFTYCPLDSLYDFTKQVVEFWQGRESARQKQPSLFLTVVALGRIGRHEHFPFMRTIEISPTTVALWYDISFVDEEGYRNAIAITV